MSKTETALLAACKLLEEITGTCPKDLYEWDHPEGCEKHCGDDVASGCWVEYMKSIASSKGAL